ncbi:hypothetical protein [Methylobacterium sp. J-070]|uniref:hypothetical protein n=1 Tax=Methylobacterium sp. J-070 TaxID=2836650 RepID=UPI001FBA1F89|nr:hypothetical protein [Methylobacterium sp. J-070]MCJ2050652.1 hypothetical protein [Methylobacterium sp. J-070]
MGAVRITEPPADALPLGVSRRRRRSAVEGKRMPVVTQVLGDTSTDGNRIRLQIIVDDHEVNEIVLCRNDVQSVVGLLIALGGQALSRSGSEQEPSTTLARPFPVDLITLGDDGRGEPVLVFSVGATALAFNFERDQLAELGRTLLAASARTDGLVN